ncbi:MAG: hypothetical protein LBL61_04390 [Elusimicrobiota bacterium]|jgi:hypothetical protein|nr:hypothetical protein [Elusimicrobiota bacterium]
MRKFVRFLISIILFSGAALPLAAAQAKFNDFAANINKDNLEYFAKDLSGLLSAGTFTTGRILGWGGFMLSGRAALMPKPSPKNTAFGPADGSQYKIYPWIQGEIGLPFRLDGYIRASSYDGLTVAGGGLKWGIIPPKEVLYTFQPTVVVLAESGVHKDFSLTHYSADLVLSFKLPYVVPYVGGGVDYIKFTVQGADNDATLIGTVAYATTPRGTAGFNFKLPAYVDLSLAANYASYGLGAEASLGVRF